MSSSSNAVEHRSVRQLKGGAGGAGLDGRIGGHAVEQLLPLQSLRGDEQPALHADPVAVHPLPAGGGYLHIDAGDAPPGVVVAGAGDLLLAVEDAMIAAQNAVVAAESLGIGSCYIGDIMENVEEIRTLLSLPEYVYPACMLVFGHPTAQQQNRTKPSRFDLSDIVCENTYHSKESSDIRRMFAGRTGLQGYDAWMRAFCNRKYESAFSREMNRSMEIYLKPFLEKEGVSDLEK